ncbi:uroporphyrinogen decarboxylase (URO-D) [Oxobacter pfennigii]|uniref:Uroporphyrinogen decarboxylase (URO-D) n=1 Tax=Oxobacter pfennigii TaxID=36849 RepID=A0A0P8YTZ0_9CLOT|nr:uroporphyrinogen decarboxylase family protein [Oxobacter pfennigii]KPU43155.1 uroporphyrinogen decarboxylase (URO-D) [Oxobacter pfennigii]
MNEEVKKKYDQRIKDYLDTVNLREPEHVLVSGGIGNAQIGLYGMTMQEVLDDPERYAKTCSKLYEDFAVDFLSGGALNPLEAIWALGRDTYFISRDGITVQHKESVPMLEDEYPQLIEDPMNFIVDTLFPRKFPLLTEGYPKSYEVLKNAAKAYQKFFAASRIYSQYCIENYGVISPVGAKSYPPFDVIFDRLRGFKGTTTDLRRQAENMGKACEAMLPIYMKPLENLTDKLPFAGTTIHCPTYLRTSDFEKYFWPTYKKMLLFAHEKGSKTSITGEGDMSRFYDLLLDLPKASVILKLEKDDIFYAKKKIGNHVAIIGNFPSSYIKYKSKQECLDMAKRIMDECAPGGGFIFGIDLPALSVSDVNAENMQAIFQFVHDYK